MWNEIKSKYPKAADKLIMWEADGYADDEPSKEMIAETTIEDCLGITSMPYTGRFLYDFFDDEFELYLVIYPNSTGSWIPYLKQNTQMVWQAESNYPSRTAAEKDGFMAACEILEKRLEGE